MTQIAQMGKGYRRFWLILVAVLGLAWPAAAQDQELTLGVHRTFGYSAGSQIQGNFRLEVSGPADLAEVTFTLDGEPLVTVTEAPFAMRLVTDGHPAGWHELGAVATTADGRTLTAAPRRFEFVAADQVWVNMGRIMLPLLAVTGLMLLVGVGAPLLATLRRRNQPALPAGAPRNYGLLGGTICPKCQRPFARHWWGLNMGVGKLDRCDHCGRWSIVRARPRHELERAEQAELEAERALTGAPPAAESEEEKLRRALEESRFEE